MTVLEVFTLLDAGRDERGIRNWQKLGSSTAGMRSYGIGLTRLRKLARRIGRNRDLALVLWETDVDDAKVIALIVDDPAQITCDQAEKQVEELASGSLWSIFKLTQSQDAAGSIKLPCCAVPSRKCRREIRLR